EDFFSNVAIVNEAFARQYLAGREAVSSRLYWKILGPEKVYTVVGVVGDSLTRLLDESAAPAVYFPGFYNFATLVVRTDRPETAAGPVSAFLRRLDPRIARYPLESLDKTLDASLGQSKAQTFLSGCFAVVALLLAASGLYSAQRYSADSRRREYAIRVA